ncbi:alpha/beta fold hydrolase, partial [Streptomyces silvisoli]
RLDQLPFGISQITTSHTAGLPQLAPSWSGNDRSRDLNSEHSLAGLLPRRLLPGLSKKLSNPVLDYPELKRSVLLGARTYRVRRPAPLPLTDEELSAIRTPTLLLIGDRSPLVHAVPARERVQRLMPNVDVELVTDTRHGPSIEHPEYVNGRILEFLKTAGMSQLPGHAA